MLAKADLIGTLEVHANNLRLANVLRVLARGGDLKSSFLEVVGSTPLSSFHPVVSLLGDAPRLVHSADLLYLAIVRAAVTECLDLTREYCKGTGQTAKLKAQPWFQTLRIIRNAFNHNFRLEFSADDRKLLPVQWRSIAISEAQANCEVTHEIFPPSVAIEWLQELDTFIADGVE